MPEDGEPREELISEGEPIKGLPRWVRFVIGFLAAAVLFISAALIAKYIDDPTKYASPRELELGNLLIFSLSVFILAIVPWGELGIRIRKIGAVEFDRIVSGQAKEHVAEFSELRSRIEELEDLVREQDSMLEIKKGLTRPALQPLVLKFLEEFQPTAYSPLRIHKWGSRQSGFEKLGDYRQGDIRIVLQDLVAEGRVATRVSRLGNTLYKIAD